MKGRVGVVTCLLLVSVVSWAQPMNMGSEAPAPPQPCPEHASCPPNAVLCGCDAEGHLVLLEFASVAQGPVDLRVTYTVDLVGHPLTEMKDYGADGEIDRIETFGYDDQGLPIVAELDLNADGVSEQRRTYTYDLQGRRISESLDLGANGSIEQVFAVEPPCPPPYSGCMNQPR